MTDSVVFSLEELKAMSNSHLRKLSEYYGLKIGGTKNELVSRLDEFYRPPIYRPPLVTENFDTKSEMSVRIKRIKESAE